MNDLEAALTYIPKMCHTCKYWEYVGGPEQMYRCTHPNRKNPCYVWNTQNWEWNGKPREIDPSAIWKNNL